MEPIYRFTSHIDGKNAKVRIYPDRIEWDREGSALARYGKATATMGLSLLAGKKHESETVLMKHITNVSVKRDGLRNSVVHVTSAGGQVGFRVSHSEAETAKKFILEQMR